MKSRKVYEWCTNHIAKDFDKLTGNPEKDFKARRKIVKDSVNCVLLHVDAENKDDEED